MRPSGVVVPYVDAENVLELAAADDQEPVEALAADAADPALDVRVGVRRPNRRADAPDAFAGEDGIERGGELAVAVVDKEAHLAAALVEVDQQVARLLQHPSGVWVPRAGEVLDAATAGREKDEHVQAPKADRVDGRKSQARIDSPCWRRKARQLCRSRRGAGGMPASASTLRTSVAKTSMPSLRSS